MMIELIGNFLGELSSIHALFALVAGGSLGMGALLCAKGAMECDGIVRGLLQSSIEESGPKLNAMESFAQPRRGRIEAWLVGGAMVGGLAAFMWNGDGTRISLYLPLGCVGGELFYRGSTERKRRSLTRSLEFFLPTAMERVVMAVSSGLDIIPALSEAARESKDPVSDVFRGIVSLSEGGIRVEHAIQMTADSVPSFPVKHALAHVALAYKQGGEIVRPLKELSDATQTHYQEAVEEEIAKLPVRAVLPLLLTFAGLIICFLTVPVLQVGASLEKFEHATK